MDQCFKSKEPACAHKTISQFLSTHIILQENKDGFHVHSIENTDQQNIPYNVKLQVKDATRFSRNDNEIPQNPESTRQQSRKIFMVFKHSTGFGQDAGNQNTQQTENSILGLFDRFLLSMMRSKVINVENI